MAMKTVLKQPEKNSQRDPGEKGWACYCCGKEGHLKRDCPQASKPPPAPCPVCKGPHWRRDCRQRRGSQESGVWLSRPSGLKVPGGPHTSSHPNYTWGAPGTDNGWRPIHQFPVRYWGNLLHAYWSPGPLSSQSASVMGLSGGAKRYYFSYSLSCNWDSVLFSHEFLIVPESPSPLLGIDILSKVHASVFMNMEPSLSLPLVEQNES